MKQDIVIGSRALAYYNIELRANNNPDIDLVTIGSPKYSNSSIRIDYLDNEELYSILEPRVKPIEGTNLLIPDIDTLLMIKLSHMNQNHNWNKHLIDLQRSKELGAFNVDTKLFNQLYDFWVKYYPIKPISLDKNPEKFFNQVSPDLHESHHYWFKLGKEPLYKLILKDNHEVMVDENKFISLNHEEKIKMCWEEVMVISHERAVPLMKGLQKVLCDLSKGFWNRYMVLHLLDVIKYYPDMKEFFKIKSNDWKKYELEK